MPKLKCILQLSGFPIRKAQSLLKEIQSAPSLMDYQKVKKWEIFKFHLKNNSLYKQYVPGNKTIWEDVPIITKHTLNTINNHKLNKPQSKFIKRSTSGSTGRTLNYRIDYLTHALTWSIINDRYTNIGISLDEKQARLYGMPQQYISLLVQKAKDLLGNRHRLNIMDLGETSLEDWINTIQKKQIVYLYGYSYPIITLAKYLIKQQKVLKDVCPLLKVCIVTSEMCSAEEEALLESALGIPVYNEYGASELGIIGFGKANNWLISDEQILVEIVDQNDKIVPNGEIGRIICTNLHNKATPFIRYEVGDMGSIEIHEGRRYLTNLIGRKEEMILLPSGRKAPGDTVFLYIIQDFSTKYNNIIIEYRVIQHTLNLFEYLIVANQQLEVQHLNYLTKLTIRSLEKKLDIRISEVEKIGRTKLGKYRRFISKIQN